MSTEQQNEVQNEQQNEQQHEHQHAHLDPRLVRAVEGFVDDPRQSVKEADAALEEAVARMERAVQSRREALREVRESCADGADTEALRVALTRYRALSAHLAP